MVPTNISDFMKEFMMTINLAREDPIFFSNNVLEPIRNRVHFDQNLNSFSVGLRQTYEGFNSVDSLIKLLCKNPRSIPGLAWNTRFESIIDPLDVSRIDFFNVHYEEA
jgi:hypothetical protein